MTNIFQQTCPGCGAALELPLEAEGKAAVCPACDHRFVASAKVADEPSELASFTAPRRRGMSGLTDGSNVRRVAIEPIFQSFQTVLSTRRRPLFLPFLIPTFLAFVGLVYPLAYLNRMAQANLATAQWWLIGLLPWFLLVLSYVIWFALNLAHDVCETTSASTGGFWFWIKPQANAYFGLLILFGMLSLTGAILATVGYLAITMTSTVSAIELRLLVSGGVIALAITTMLAICMRIWPLFPLIYRDGISRQVIRRGLALSGANLMTSFLLVATLGFLLGSGFSFALIGLPLAIPVAAVFLVVAAYRMEGAPIAAVDVPEGQWTDDRSLVENRESQ